MLIVMSEINCLKALENRGVYPDKFYTSFDSFKEDVIHFQDTVVVIIMAGSCRFNKHLMLDEINKIYRRYENDHDKGVTALYVFSDCVLPNFKQFYYKFEGNFERIDQYKGGIRTRQDLVVWDKFQTTPHEVECVLSRFDRGETTHIRDEFENRFRNDDAYIELIKVPHIEPAL